MKLLTIVGARPQFIKAATVSRAIAQHNQHHPDRPVHEIIVHTGQHYDTNMSDVFFEQMQIPHPDYHLNIGGMSHGAMTGRMLEKIEQAILDEQPDAVLVYGDTNSTLAGALAAAKLHVPVAHVEAGLRSYNLRMPEEVNRVLTDQISHWLFCPTDTAINNLAKENIPGSRPVQVKKVGDVMYDAVLFYQKIAQPSAAIATLLDELDAPFYLATLHRAENTNDPTRLNHIMTALDTISRTRPVLLPLHPRTQKYLKDSSFPHIRLLAPVSYFDMITLLSRCQGVLTDSGGLQKEAYFFQKPCITLRDETEWVELVEKGFNRVVEANLEKILEAEESIRHKSTYWQMERSNDLYGQGNAAINILKTLLEADF
ncbi:UDP-2,3-diacetamido-2,3-dideoxy-D-glucuronate 2-epimerase [Halomicronema hongdechloris C2206]|uniref:UDP-2,3-diacetamido-2,3-dideoxy-D-glucuronate 2-epimerase n=1 Tax=Halomicronema hongdechloris C2206 TaxID=1641165 RepID=A0A1Z3HKI2_9CYAN|nr:UDP-N-acetylglucosamine 2-epimerase (non-hydrolyzing) [Halomicronema hongdechloris]ASC70810.1 UDP-2,3-diacetamido-2,3-dideoxy-D-glucuronate 2-epimerase [Halomicronema hongdechloris C2206]